MGQRLQQAGSDSVQELMHSVMEPCSQPQPSGSVLLRAVSHRPPVLSASPGPAGYWGALGWTGELGASSWRELGGDHHHLKSSWSPKCRAKFPATARQGGKSREEKERVDRAGCLCLALGKKLYF